MSGPEDCIAGCIEVSTSQPIPENGSTDGVDTAADIQPAAERVCGRCGTSNAQPADRCSRCQSWLPGNAGAVTTGIYRKEPPNDLRESADALIAGIIADRGGVEELTTTERATVRNLGDLAILLQLLTNEMAKGGLLTPGGNVRQVYAQYLAGLDRFDRLIARIGLDRRAKRVVSMMDAMRQQGDRS
jgi:hypothetical protein